MISKVKITRTQIEDIRSQTGLDDIQKMEEILTDALHLKINEIIWHNSFNLGSSKKGPINEPIIVDNVQDFKAIFGSSDKTLDRRNNSFIRNNITGKRIFSEMDPYGEENWED